MFSWTPNCMRTNWLQRADCFCQLYNLVRILFLFCCMILSELPKKKTGAHTILLFCGRRDHYWGFIEKKSNICWLFNEKTMEKVLQSALCASSLKCYQFNWDLLKYWDNLPPLWKWAAWSHSSLTINVKVILHPRIISLNQNRFILSEWPSGRLSLWCDAVECWSDL